MSRLFFIASYPRSGNTYVRALLSNYVSGLAAPLNVNALHAYARGEHDEGLWRELTGLEPPDRSLEQQWRLRPGYFEGLRKAASDGALFVKTHTANAAAFDQPAFELREGDRAIYVVRHPCDVALSRADFDGIPMEEIVDELLRPGAFVDGRPRHGFEVTGSWQENVTSWQNEARCPVLWVRYPDLCQNPLFELSRMVSFLGLGVNPERVTAAVVFSRFEELQAQETTHGFAEYARGQASRRFFRVGRARQWPQVMPPAMARRIYERCGPLIEQLGLDQPAAAEAATAAAG